MYFCFRLHSSLIECFLPGTLHSLICYTKLGALAIPFPSKTLVSCRILTESLLQFKQFPYAARERNSISSRMRSGRCQVLHRIAKLCVPEGHVFKMQRAYVAAGRAVRWMHGSWCKTLHELKLKNFAIVWRLARFSLTPNEALPIHMNLSFLM